jgi:hypothetical protein
MLALLFACVVALGEANRAYGNFAFVRMFHGKAILATCLVPAIAAAAWSYARHGGVRWWLLLLATQVAALGAAASAVFVAPAAAALGLAGGWTPDRVRSARFVLGMATAGYLVAAAWLVGHGTPQAHALALPHPQPMPDVPALLHRTWGQWSTRILLVALLAAWPFVRDPVRARYFSAGACCFLLAALNPYTTPFVAEATIGAKTYWRLTWALPLPLFAAVVLDGLALRALALRPKALAFSTCLVLAVPAVVFCARSGSLRPANGVTVSMPGPKVPHAEYEAARRVATRLPETATVLAPESVAAWLTGFVAHPRLVGVRHLYLSLAFPPTETAERSNLMRLLEGRYFPADKRWFTRALARQRVDAVVLPRVNPHAATLRAWLGNEGWEALGPADEAGYAILACTRACQARRAPVVERIDRRGGIHQGNASGAGAAVTQDPEERVGVEPGR